MLGLLWMHLRGGLDSASTCVSLVSRGVETVCVLCVCFRVRRNLSVVRDSSKTASAAPNTDSLLVGVEADLPSAPASVCSTSVFELRLQLGHVR